jgi:small-conductance mechanosensitive channel/CRP-like cAMP-binding protein
MLTGIALVTAALILRGVIRNRHVRGRLLASMIAFAGYAVLSAALTYGALSPDVEPPIRLTALLLVVFGVLNSAVALAINRWRIDERPDRFPTIVQDVIVITLFAVAATVILQERVFAATAVGAVVVGFAMQDTLGNLFAGLAIQIEKPFHVGHWVRVAGIDGLVSEITWRATKVRTKTGNFVIVPNSVLSRDTIINYSEPSPETCMEIDVGASYGALPNDVKAAIHAAIEDEPLLSKVTPPEVLIVDFAASAVVYRIRVWTTLFAETDRLVDRIRSAVYYAFRRRGIEIPFPIQVEIQREDAPAAPAADPRAASDALRTVQIFASLSEQERAELASQTRRVLFAAGERIVKQDGEGDSMFVVTRGSVVITREPGQREVARIGPGGYFGEMSLLTGDRRSATVRAAADAELLEITVDSFRRFVMANPSAVDEIGKAAMARKAELDRLATDDRTSTTAEPPQRFLMRVRRFLQLAIE